MKRSRWFLLASAAGLGFGLLGYALAQPRGVPAVSSDETGAVSVERRTIASRTKVEGTLGYSGDDSVVNHLAGYFTWLPAVDQTVVPGEVLYRVGALSVVLLRGSIPAWRDLSRGDSGDDVEQLNAALAELGLLENRPESSRRFDAATEAAVQALQTKIGAHPDGSLPLGHAVFFPSSLRLVSVVPVLGSRADGNTVVLKATSTSRRVTAFVSAFQLKRLKVGDQVTLTLNFSGPDQKVFSGRIARLSTSARPGSVSDGVPLFQVDILPGESSLDGIDQMPVQVGFTDAVAKDALVVPVTALLSTPGQGYAVEVLRAGVRSLVSVQLGVFSDADGLVQVAGEGLGEGDKVVVPGL